MKKSVKLAIWISITIVILIVASIRIAKIYKHEMEKRNDPVIKAIQEVLKDDVTLCEYRKNEDSGIRYYVYSLNVYEKAVIAEMESALKSIEEKTQNHICVTIWDDMSFGRGNGLSVFALENYSSEGVLTEDGKLSYLYIPNSDHARHEEFYMNPDTYTALSDIRYLEIEYPMQKLAEEAGIDWYEVWPELESAKKFTRGELGREIYTDILRRD